MVKVSPSGSEMLGIRISTLLLANISNSLGSSLEIKMGGPVFMSELTILLKNEVAFVTVSVNRYD